MFVKVKFFQAPAQAYAGREYLYRTELPLLGREKVMAPTASGDKRAMVTKVKVSGEEIDPAWAHNIREITELDTTDE